ncbi:hypothetical protein [uncultured Pseudodesulfovibrio sp.]|uniref:hypothetical protein n=1 Tax=uncultured Pseudodesulfovibrio sp. TaxID=2035858 RepID=UPI0029C6C796|nr:hypothetical protein [uncultured Pseudodesulfovibrio sp.]
MFEGFVTRKGWASSIPNVNDFSEIDFAAIEEETNLKFNDEIRSNIKLTLAHYVSQVKSYERRKPKRRKLRLKAVEKACLLLESFLELDAYGVAEDVDVLQQYLWDKVMPRVNCFIEDDEYGKRQLAIRERDFSDFNDKSPLPFDGKVVSAYLALCRKKVRQELKTNYSAGNKMNEALRLCLEKLYDDFIRAGGKGRECSRAQGEWFYEGPVLSYFKALLDYTQKPLGLSDSPYSVSTLGEYAVNDLQL